MSRCKSRKQKEKERLQNYHTQQNEARRYVFGTAFNDRQIGETVCMSTPEQISNHLSTAFPDQPQVYFPKEFAGAVLMGQLSYTFYSNGE